MVLNPFAVVDGQIVTVDDVERGDDRAVCPGCNNRLIAKKGSFVIHHFAHLGCSERVGCSETALHRYAKEYLARSVGKHLTVPGFGGNAAGEVRIKRAAPEMWFPSKTRRCDIGLLVEPTSGFGERRSYGRKARIYGAPFKLAVEICVTNPKDAAYSDDATRDELHALEVVITPAAVLKWRSEHTTYTVEHTVKHLVLNNPKNRRWLTPPHPDVDPASVQPLYGPGRP